MTSTLAIVLALMVQPPMAGLAKKNNAVSKRVILPAKPATKKIKKPHRPRGPTAPRTPKGLEPCTVHMEGAGDLPRRIGETIRYAVDINGVSVGSIDFKTVQTANFEDSVVTEYRSHFKIDSLISAFVSVEGRAASLVKLGEHLPVRSMSRFRLKDKPYEEDVTFSRGDHRLKSVRKYNGKPRTDRRHFVVPARDFISGFYFMRSLPAATSGCVIIYGNQRAYTIWVEHVGQEEVKTPVGMRLADHYAVRYASERVRSVRLGHVWLSAGAERLPYRVELSGKYDLAARIHMYVPGE